MFARIKFNIFEISLILAIIVLNIIDNWNRTQINYLGIITSVSGITCMVLAAKGSLINYLFGILNTLLYAYIAYQVPFWGEVMLNIGLNLPMQFIGFYLWKKNLSSQHTIVKPRSLSIKLRILLSITVIISIIFYSYLLKYLKDASPIIDSASAIIALVAMILSIFRYKELWVLWIVGNTINVILWGTSFDHQTEQSFIMLATRCLYLMNSIYGIYNWTLLEKDKVKGGLTFKK